MDAINEQRMADEVGMEDTLAALRASWGTTPTTGYVPDRSPTGVAMGVLVELRDGYWYVVGLDVPVARGTSVYATRDGAVYAARRRWRCNLPGLNSGTGRREARKAVQP